MSDGGGAFWVVTSHAFLPHHAQATPRCGPAAILTRPSTLRYYRLCASFIGFVKCIDPTVKCRRAVGWVRMA